MPPGTVAKKTRRGAITEVERKLTLCQQACKDLDYNPFAELIGLAQETTEVEVKGRLIQIPTASVGERIKIACEVAAYMDSKQKGVDPEGSAKGNNSFHITINKFESKGSPHAKIEKRVEEVVEQMSKVTLTKI
jgi:hypothetical protein